VQEEATQLAGDVADADPAVGLAAVAALRALLDTLERLQVGRAREQGWQWQRIAAALGVSKQAVHKKYADGR
jgi:Homeodomain-like domain